ncbi:hypothetical protein HK101_002112 [Irineochytrium annulatum]|nr:hypothetical protein HK101_002112 [Irineochytrium annulatum]
MQFYCTCGTRGRPRFADDLPQWALELGVNPEVHREAISKLNGCVHRLFNPFKQILFLSLFTGLLVMEILLCMRVFVIYDFPQAALFGWVVIAVIYSVDHTFIWNRVRVQMSALCVQYSDGRMTYTIVMFYKKNMW